MLRHSTRRPIKLDAHPWKESPSFGWFCSSTKDAWRLQRRSGEPTGGARPSRPPHPDGEEDRRQAPRCLPREQPVLRCHQHRQRCTYLLHPSKPVPATTKVRSTTTLQRIISLVRQPLFPSSVLGRSFAVSDEIFCLFKGTLENLPSLKHHYGLGKNASEVVLVMEAYRALRDRAPYPTNLMLAHLVGNFAFIVFDNVTSTVFAASVSIMAHGRW